MSGSLALVMTAQGAQPTPPATIQQTLVGNVAAESPGYTASLPGSLIEDISSTDVAAIALCDSARVELVNSLTPYGANAFLLNQLGQVYGVPLGQGSTTSAYIVITGPPGFLIPIGFTVSDGTFQYTVQDGGAIGSGSGTGETAPLYVLSTTQGSWAVPANTITQIVSSVPTGYTLTVTNPTAGTPGTSAQTEESYRAQVLQAGQAVSLGMPSLVKTAVLNVPGVQSRLVSMRQQSLAGWEVIVGGGDPYQVAGAIFTSMADISLLVGSVIDTSRNETVSIINPPDTYAVTFVIPPLQTVGVLVTWNTTATNLISDSAVTSLSVPAIISYINSITVGNPINIFELQSAFQIAVAPIIPTALLTRLVIAVTINGTGVEPVDGTGIIVGDPESYFYTSATNITVTQG